MSLHEDEFKIVNSDGDPILFVNVYKVDRQYGGPEEGGWYYDAGRAVKSFAVLSYEEAEELAANLREEYPKTGKRYSVLWGEDFDVIIEKKPGKDFPEFTPYYE